MEDWDLLAVVRGGNYNINGGMESPITSSSSGFAPISIDQAENDDLSLVHTYPHLFETTTALDELEELYKPFYPVLAQYTNNNSLSTFPTTSNIFPPKHLDVGQQSQKLIMKPAAASKYKKRKNQQKRVVKEVKEDGICSDMWAWRKYGQKPIKGSPYPRSYYRCSSSKGCSARKQVERSPSDPNIFIITYTSEHTHAHPTRRNSLAGSTRNKFPMVTTSPTTGANANPPLIISKTQLEKSNCTNSSDNLDSNINVVNPSLETVSSTKRDDATINEDLEKVSSTMEDGESCSTEINGMNINNVVFGHDQSFPSLEDLELGTNFGGFDLDELFPDHDHFMDATLFIDQYSTTVSGACYC